MSKHMSKTCAVNWKWLDVYSLVYFVVLGVGLSSGEIHDVHTSLGNVSGTIEEVSIYNDDGTMSVETYVQYLGIPYAEPPTGNRRFAKPVPKGAWTGTYNGTFYRPVCYGNRDIPGAFDIKDFEMSEDCLTLNIFSPITTTSGGGPYPVVVYIHSSPGSSRPFIGDVLSVYGELVVVIINFRQGLLGFLSTGDEAAPGNFGLWDQQMAIAWVNEHIVSFGGNPGMVTLIGHSTGASNAILQSFNLRNYGHIEGIVAMSGTPLPTYVKSSFLQDPLGKEFAKTINCNRDTNGGMIACLRGKTIEELRQALRSSTKTFNFKPVIDGDFLTVDPQEILNILNEKYEEERKGFYGVDLLLGLNNNEGGAHVALMWKDLLNHEIDTFDVNKTEFDTIVVPTAMKVVFGENITKSVLQTVSFQYTDLTDTSVRESVVDISTDIDLAAALIKTANAHVMDNTKNTFLYQFSERLGLQNVLTPSWLDGANRGDDVYFLFGFSQRGLDTLVHGGNFTPSREQREVSRQFMTAIATFANKGNPTPPNATSTLLSNWPPYTQTTMPYLDISYNKTSSKRHFREPYMTFWTKLIPSLLQDFADLAPDDSPMTDMCPREIGLRFQVDMLTAENIILALSICGFCLLIACLLIIALSVAKQRSLTGEYNLKST